MRFGEFNPHRKKVDEIIPAVGQALKTVGSSAIAATKALAGTVQKGMRAPGSMIPKGVKLPPGAPNTGTGMQGVGQAATPPSKFSTQQPSTSDATKNMQIPAVGSKIVLPDRDTKKPNTYTIKSMRGNDVDITPSAPVKTGDPNVDIKVKAKDLQNTLKAIDPQADTTKAKP